VERGRKGRKCARMWARSKKLCVVRGQAGLVALRSSSTLRDALTEATLPVVTRRTWMCPSHLLAAAVKCRALCHVDSTTPQAPEACENSPVFRTGPTTLHHMMVIHRFFMVRLFLCTGKRLRTFCITLCCYPKNMRQKEKKKGTVSRE
jgi:hypothetical protein